MSASTRRLSLVGAVYGVALALVLGHLGWLMLVDHEDWLVRSYQNRWAFRDVPSIRGSLCDRFDRVLVTDEPTFELSCVYENFRLLHPVAAAVHGATQWAAVHGSGARYGFLAGSLGPEAAFADVMQIPAAVLLGGELPKELRKELARAAMVLLVACSEQPASEVRAALRAAAARRPLCPLGEALPERTCEQLAAQFAAILGRLRALDAAVAEVRSAAGRAGGGVADAGDDAGPDDEAAVATVGLLSQLDRFRVDSLEQRRIRRQGAAAGEGELLERSSRPVLRSVPFAMAAALAVAAGDQPGLRLEPSLRRVRTERLPPTLQQLLGGVADIEQNPGPPAYLAARVEAALGSELEELVPGDLGPTLEYRESLRQEAQRSYARVLRARERRGTGGIEAALDDALAGAPGMRLVEHDARAREQRLWSSLRVEPGTDVALTIDLDLQQLLDERVTAAAAHWQQVAGRKGADPGRVDVACVLLDARTGDVLALAGAPTELDGKPRLPAVLSWRGDGAIGSVAKPLFLVEHLLSAAAGLPHRDLATLVPCARDYLRVGGQMLRCDHAHGDAGKDPAFALAQSCNVFFFQLAEGLEEAGLRRALWRFGLLPPDAGDGDGRHQARPAELPPAMAPAPRWIGRQFVQMRGIGYGIESSPLAIARAYAALATGSLPTLGLRRGQARPVRPLGLPAAELQLVQQGLRECVTRGTADELKELQRWQVHAKTGTAEIAGRRREDPNNNAWFAGFLPTATKDGVQLCFGAVVYAVPDKTHGADAAGLLVQDLLAAIAADPVLDARYLQTEGR